MISVDVIVPYAGGCEHRARNWAWLKGKYGSANLHVVEGAGTATSWCKAKAVSDALDRSDAEVVAIVDADVWCEGLRASIDAVSAGARWSVPHWNVCRLTRHGTDLFIAGDGDGVETEERHVGMVGGGIVVLPRETYEQIPLDARFVGWGGEDQAWGLALTRLLGQPARLEAPLIHMWHPPQARRSRHRGSVENQALLTRYAESDADDLRELIEEGRCQSIDSSRLR